jgi:hypothetical protein
LVLNAIKVTLVVIAGLAFVLITPNFMLVLPAFPQNGGNLPTNATGGTTDFGSGNPPTNATGGTTDFGSGNPPTNATGGGGCLIATAAFGSELSPQVQFLRDFRDSRILSTTAGSSFMNVFNTWYYSFSPYVADYERQQPWLQQIIKTAIYPLLGVLQISEKAYSSIPGEFGALAAGAIASSLIGAIYFWPLSIFFIRKRIRRKKENDNKLDYKIVVVASMIGIATVTIAVICSILFTDSAILLMITTSLFILTILTTSAIYCAEGVLRVSRRVRSPFTRTMIQN